MKSNIDPGNQASEGNQWHFGLIGWPLGHSISPVLHAAALEALGEKGNYDLFPIPREDFEHDFQTLLEKLRKGQLHGLNVTIPYKRSVMPYLDRLTQAAASVGAVNSIVLKDGLLTGDNTDTGGFSAELKQIIISPAANEKRRAIVLGAGGAARAAVYVLLEAGWSVTVAARSLRQAALLIRDFPDHLVCAAPLDETLSWTPVELLINATPVGMHPDINCSPWPAGSPLPNGARIFDLVYKPPETLFMKMTPNCRSGLGMLVEQAALAFESWTGLPAGRAAMRISAETALGLVSAAA